MAKKILVLGADGMLGHVVTAFLKEHNYSVFTTSRKNNSDYYYDVFKNVYKIEEIIKTVSPDVIINCVGILNTAAENNHALAIMVNSFLPNYLDLISEKNDFQLVHITTDCVFSGKDGNYNEDSISDATSFYGKSKAIGEVKNDRTLTLRTSIVGPDSNPKGIGLFKWFSEQNGAVSGYSNVIWTGVTTIELAKVIEFSISNNIKGFHHVVNNEKISKYELLKLFEKYFKFGIDVEKDNNYKSDKSLVRTEKSYNFDIPSYDIMVKNMYNWIITHSDLYPDLIERMN